MPDLFEGFRWREVFAVIGAVVFFVLILIDSVRDQQNYVDQQLNMMRERLRVVEIQNVALQCAMNPELCRAIPRDAP